MNNTDEAFVKIGIVGVGGAGNNIIQRMCYENIQMVDYISVHSGNPNTNHTKINKRIQIGFKYTKYTGAGSNPDLGKSAVKTHINEIADAIRGYDMIFVVAGMGGGTGTGAAPLIARTALNMGILTIAVVTKPFFFEGRKKLQIAENGIVTLKENVDSMLIIPNENLKNISNVSTSMIEAFDSVNEILIQMVKNIVEVIQNPATINCDFADIRSVLSDAGHIHTATGYADGDVRAEKIVNQIKENALLGTTAKSSKSALLYISSAQLNMQEVSIIASAITDMADDDINLILGINAEKDTDDKLKAVLISTF